jgi:lysyl-tRNA synthetase class 2
MNSEDSRKQIWKEIENEEEISEESLNEMRLIRREKLKKLQEMGRDPFLVESWDVKNYSMDIKNNFDEMEGKVVSCAGRIMAKRQMGKASFIDIQDQQGRIQCYIRQDVITPEEYEIFLTYDIGDIVGVVGEVFKTKHGEISIKVSEIKLLTKSLQILPNKFHGLKDHETRYRQRYVDLIVNPEVKEKFILRSKIIKEIKNYLERRGFQSRDRIQNASLRHIFVNPDTTSNPLLEDLVP